MAEPDDLLRRARESVESPNASGDCLSHEELAELVNKWVFEHTEGGRIIELDANYIGKLEQGSIRWPQDPNRRAGLRAVLGVATDAELGFRRPRRSRIMVRGVDRQHFIRAGLGASVAAAAGPAALLELLAPTQPTQVPSAVSVTNIAQVRATRLTATEQALLHTSRARDLAKLGETQDALRAVATADRIRTVLTAA